MATTTDDPYIRWYFCYKVSLGAWSQWPLKPAGPLYAWILIISGVFCIPEWEGRRKMTFLCLIMKLLDPEKKSLSLWRKAVFRSYKRNLMMWCWDLAVQSRPGQVQFDFKWYFFSKLATWHSLICSRSFNIFFWLFFFFFFSLKFKKLPSISVVNLVMYVTPRNSWLTF